MQWTSRPKRLTAIGKAWEVRALSRQWLRQAGGHTTVRDFIDRRQNTRNVQTRPPRRQPRKNKGLSLPISPWS